MHITPDLERRWTVAAPPVDGPVAAGLLRDYYVDIVGRYYGRDATEAEVDKALADFPSDDLAPPTGRFLVAHLDGVPSGCVGLRLWAAGLAEVTRMYVRADARGLGGAALLLAGIEDAARAAGVTIVRLDTRSDLVEARTLYARHGYAEIPRYTDSPYADHCFEKRLG